MSSTRLEGDIQRDIIRALEKCGCWVIRTQVSGRRGARSVATGEPGMPDLYLPGLGHLEVKTDSGRLSPDQSRWHERARENGVRVETVRSVSEAIQTVSRWRSS